MTETATLYAELAEAPDYGRAFWLQSGKLRIRAAVWDQGTRGTVVIFTGRTEYIEKYGRVITEFAERGFSVAICDWRGQGLSDRRLSDRMKGHVVSFDAYQRDVNAFLNAPAVAALPHPHVLLCHSMGGCIGLRSLLEENISPKAAIFSAPMFGLNLSSIQQFGTDMILGAAQRFGFEQSYTPMPNADQPYVAANSFIGNVLTGDHDHYNWFRKHLDAEPDFGLGAPTLGWLSAAREEMEALAEAPAPDLPTMVMVGGKEEVVSPDAIRAFAEKSESCRLLEIEGGKHETLFETPEIREEAWAAIDDFLLEAGV